MIEVVGYLRVSSEGQTEGDGFARQEATVRNFCQSKGWAVAEVFDDATSGRNDLDSREGLTTAMEHLSRVQGRRIIVVEAQSRWARDVIVSEMLLRECRKAQIEVWSATSGSNLCEDGDDGTSKFIRQLMSVVDEFDKHRLVHRMRVARQRKKRETGGRAGVEGVRPFGSRPGELRVLLHMNDLRGQERSLVEIADELNRQRLFTRSGTPWSSGQVWRTLNNPRSQLMVQER